MQNMQPYAVRKHLASAKHLKNLQKIVMQQMALKKLDFTFEGMNTEKSRVSKTTLLERRRLVQVAVQSAVPLKKVITGPLGDWIGEKAGFSLSTPGHMTRDHVPALLKLEESMPQEELKGNEVSLMQDGTPFHGELFATIARYVREEPWKVAVCNRLIDLFPAQSSLNALRVHQF